MVRGSQVSFQSTKSILLIRLPRTLGRGVSYSVPKSSYVVSLYCTFSVPSHIYNPVDHEIHRHPSIASTKVARTHLGKNLAPTLPSSCIIRRGKGPTVVLYLILGGAPTMHLSAQELMDTGKPDGRQQGTSAASNFADRHGITIASNSANQYGCIYRVFMDLIMSVFVLTHGPGDC
jgi:hypothetical protein